MSRFHFRLQTLRRLREIDRDERRGKLATALEAERILSAQRAALEVEMTALAQAQRALMQQGSLDVNRLLTSQRYQLALEAQQRTLTEQAAKLADEVERRRSAVVEADRQVRTLDKLEDRARLLHSERRQRAETKLMDEIAATRWEAPR